MRTLTNIFDFAFFAAEADEDTHVLGYCHCYNITDKAL